MLPWCAVAVDSEGVAWVNDSKATNVESTAAGLRGLSLPLPGQPPGLSSKPQTGAGVGDDRDRTGSRIAEGEGATGTEGGRAVVLLGGVAKVRSHVLTSGNPLPLPLPAHFPF